MAFTCYFCKIFETLTHTVSEARAKTEYPWLVIKADGNILGMALIRERYFFEIRKGSSSENKRSNAMIFGYVRDETLTKIFFNSNVF